MSEAVAVEIAPAGTWRSDPTHSWAAFSIKHMVVATFRARFERFEATLEVGEDGAARLRGAVDASSITIPDEGLASQLFGADFFDVEHHPQILFESDSLQRAGDDLALAGALTIRGVTREVSARGTVSGPGVTLDGSTRLGMSLAATVEREPFGMRWNMPLPKGGMVLADDVRLEVELELVLDEA